MKQLWNDYVTMRMQTGSAVPSRDRRDAIQEQGHSDTKPAGGMAARQRLSSGWGATYPRLAAPLQEPVYRVGCSARIYDAIQGHSGKTASENYGDVSLKAKVNAINKLPTYGLSA
ncbi:hypothetical protein [Phaeobacter sp. C3_T13_0]|uniref:hypothetical protein n=1 Tax=Phaeobacter cretensis TaxID=3342641 RepID=UPI0039BC23C6